MTLIEHRPTQPTRRPSDPPIEVRAIGDQLEIRPRRCLDDDGLAALAAALQGALHAGITATVAFEPDPDAIDEGLPAIAPAGAALALDTVTGRWLLDVRTRRLCRGVDRGLRFMPPGAWVVVRSVTVSADSVSAVTEHGSRVTARRGTAPPTLVA